MLILSSNYCFKPTKTKGLCRGADILKPYNLTPWFFKILNPAMLLVGWLLYRQELWTNQWQKYQKQKEQKDKKTARKNEEQSEGHTDR